MPALRPHAFQNGPERRAFLRIPDPALSCHVRDFGRGVIGNDRPLFLPDHTYENVPRVRYGGPRNLPGNNLPCHDPETVDVAGVRASGRVKHLPLTRKSSVAHARVGGGCERCRAKQKNIDRNVSVFCCESIVDGLLEQ